MPQVVVAALTIFGNAVVALGSIGTAMGFGIGVGALAAGAAVVIGGVMVAKRVMSLFEVEMPTVDTDASRQRTVKSTTEPQKIIYGEALVSGPISFIGLSGTDNSDLYQTIVLAGHEVTEITDIHMDDIVISNAYINGGSAAGGAVGSGSIEFGPKNSNTICVINKYKGETSQTADVLFTSAFSTGPANNQYTSAHRGDGIAYLAMKWTLNEDSAETWDKFAPSNVKALVKGKSVYDPRTDTTVYSDNPALCLADYLTDTYLGMGIPTSKIDWDAVEIAAIGCDFEVDVPNNAKEKRFTCNGVVFATDSHQKNINKILSSMNGNLVYSNGKYIVRAGIYEAPTETLTEDDLIGAISIKTSLERSDRFNTIKGLFIDPAQNHKSSEFPKVQLADAVARDNGEILEKEVQYPMTNSSYMAQRLSHKLIQLSDQQKVVTFPANLSALRITAGDRVQVSVEELNWSNKVFQCVGWTFSEEGGVNLTLLEDSSNSYDDPTVTPNNEYSTITATGSITDAFRGVPSPSGLTATAGLKSNELNWVNPGKPNDFGTIYVYASRNANFSSAVKIGETDGTQFIHDGSNKSLIFLPSVVNVGDTYTIKTLGDTDFEAMGAPAEFGVGTVFTATATGSGTGDLWETLSPGDLRYYWVRAVRNVGTDTASQSDLEPDDDPNTTVFATVGGVEWADVSGSTDAPEDNATVGATLGVDFYDIDNTSVLLDSGIRNQTIVDIELEDITAGSFAIGVTYVITSIGTTDFTLIGASDNLVGLVFTATGVGSGTGTVSNRGIVSTESNDNLSVQTAGEVGIYTYTQVTALGAQYSVKIDNNGRVAGFGLSSTLPTNTTDPAFSEFVVVADRFAIVDPLSTELEPIQPFTVTSQKIVMSSNVEINGDLLTTGTTISDLALQVGSGSSFFKASSDGLQLGNETFSSAPFRVTPAGALTATSVELTGSLTATALNVTNITGAVTGFDAGKISGNVTEVYPVSAVPNVNLNNDPNPDPTNLFEFSIPTPENGVAKRHGLSLALEFSSVRSSGSGLDSHTIWYWVSRKSLGFETVSIGDITHVSTIVSGNLEAYSIDGNVTDTMDNNGAIAPNTNPSSNEIGKIVGVFYEAASNKTRITVSFGGGTSPHYADGTEMYFSPSQFTAAGIYPTPDSKSFQSILLDGSSITYHSVTLSTSFGATTVATDYRLYAERAAQYSGLTVSCRKVYGRVENIA